MSSRRRHTCGSLATGVQTGALPIFINDIGVSLTGEGGSASPAEETRDATRAAGGEAAISTDSVADPDSAKKIVQCALDSFGSIDAVVNNAGILRDSIFHKMTADDRSEEHTSELQSLMRISYAVFCLKKKKEQSHHYQHRT